MKIRLERARSKVSAFFCVLVLSAMGPTDLHSSAPSIDSATAYTLKVSDVAKVARLVESVGGEVERTMSTLGLVSAELTNGQLDLVSRSSLVSRIYDTSTIASSKRSSNLSKGTLAGYFWEY
jgi:hypothetical protein